MNYRQLASAALLAFERSSGRRAENCKLLLHLPAFTSPVDRFQRPARGTVCLHSRARVCCVRAHVLSSTSCAPLPLSLVCLGSHPFPLFHLSHSLCLPRPAPTSKPVNHQSSPSAAPCFSPSSGYRVRSKEKPTPLGLSIRH